MGDKEFISFDLFMDALIIISIEYNANEEFNDLEKITYLFEKMSQSKGIGKSQMRSGKQL